MHRYVERRGHCSTICARPAAQDDAKIVVIPLLPFYISFKSAILLLHQLNNRKDFETTRKEGKENL